MLIMFCIRLMLHFESIKMPFIEKCGHLQMEAFSRTEDFPKIVEAYSRPVRIIRGKQIEYAWEVRAAFTYTYQRNSLTYSKCSLSHEPSLLMRYAGRRKRIPERRRKGLVERLLGGCR